MKRSKRRSLIEAELQMDLLLKRVGYSGKCKVDSVNEIPSYKLTIKNPTSDLVPGGSYKRAEPRYTGDEIMGIVVTHKSNLMPIRKDNKQAAVDASQMRRN
jgi:hypothetical protein